MWGSVGYDSVQSFRSCVPDHVNDLVSFEYRRCKRAMMA